MYQLPSFGKDLLMIILTLSKCCFDFLYFPSILLHVLLAHDFLCVAADWGYWHLSVLPFTNSECLSLVNLTFITLVWITLQQGAGMLLCP